MNFVVLLADYVKRIFSINEYNNNNYTIHHDIIIIIYFENVTFFHAKQSKLGSDVRPKVDNQTSGNTLQELIRLDH